MSSRHIQKAGHTEGTAMFSVFTWKTCIDVRWAFIEESRHFILLVIAFNNTIVIVFHAAYWPCLPVTSKEARARLLIPLEWKERASYIPWKFVYCILQHDGVEIFESSTRIQPAFKLLQVHWPIPKLTCGDMVSLINNNYLHDCNLINY